ncbi:MAG: hypothetical protein GX265_04015 [Mollicutes bacterium]|nr:hypothetical protein [Mollicutes bacterium]
MTIDRENFEKEEKQLKRYQPEKQRLEMILNHIRQCNTFEDLKHHTISTMYGFEQLKYDMNDCYSFRLSKKGWVDKINC